LHWTGVHSYVAGCSKRHCSKKLNTIYCDASSFSRPQKKDFPSLLPLSYLSQRERRLKEKQPPFFQRAGNASPQTV
jgi:hypothetical protein